MGKCKINVQNEFEEKSLKATIKLRRLLNLVCTVFYDPLHGIYLFLGPTIRDCYDIDWSIINRASYIEVVEGLIEMVEGIRKELEIAQNTLAIEEAEIVLTKLESLKVNLDWNSFEY